VVIEEGKGKRRKRGMVGFGWLLCPAGMGTEPHIGWRSNKMKNVSTLNPRQSRKKERKKKKGERNNIKR